MTPVQSLNVVPTSVTTPILRSDFGLTDAAASDGAAEPPLEAAADGALDAAPDGAPDAAVLLHAATRMDNPANRVSPVLRKRMCPPPETRTGPSAAVS